MKQTRKLIALLLAVIMMFCLTGCGSFEGKMAKAALKMQKLQSLRADISIDLGLSMSMFGEAMDLDMTINGPVDVIISPLQGKADLSLNMLDENLDILCYMEQKEGKLLVYASTDEDDNWVKTEVDLSQFPENGKLDTKGLAQLAKLAASFEESGTKTVKGSEASIYSGKVAWSELESTADMESIMNTMADSAGSGLDLSGLDFSQLGDIPLSIGVDNKSGMVVKYTMDLTEMMQSLLPMIMDAAVKAAMSESGVSGLDGFDLSSLGLEFNLNKLTADAELYDFDSVSEIVIPDAALNAENIAA